MIAALILAHQAPELLGRLVRRLEAYGAQCFIHVDSKADITPFHTACSAAAKAVFLEHRIKVRWGGFSMIEATLSLLSTALSKQAFTHFVFISGNSYPIKPREQFLQMVTMPLEQMELRVIPPGSAVYKRIAQTFIPDTSVGAFRQDGDWTLQRFLTEDTVADFDRIRRVFEMKKTEFPWRYAKGSQWWILTRATALRCLDVLARETDFVNWFTYSSVPDEALFQTIIENFVPFNVKRESPVYTLWNSSPRPYLFRDSEDLERLKNAPAPFARKFSIEHGCLLLDLLDEWMDSFETPRANDIVTEWKEPRAQTRTRRGRRPLSGT